MSNIFFKKTSIYYSWYLGFPSGSVNKESTCSSGNVVLIPGLGRYPGGGLSNSLQYSCLENPMGWGAWWAAVHKVSKSQTWLSNWASTYGYYLCEDAVIILFYWIIEGQQLTKPVMLKKYSYPKSWELCFIWWEFLQYQAQEAVSQVTLRELLWGGRGGGGERRQFIY